MTSRMAGSRNVMRSNRAPFDAPVGDQEVPGDHQLVFLGVAGEVHDLHSGRGAAGDVLQDVAVAMNSTWPEVEGHVEVVVLERRVLALGSRTSSRAAGVAWKLAFSLSTIEAMSTGFRVPALRIPWMIRPGSAPM